MKKTTASLETPALLLDRNSLDKNLARMRRQIDRWPHLSFRPHLKTAKSIAAARYLFGGREGPITVSTLREAERFFAAGFTDILYAVGIAPGKLARAAELRREGCDLKIILDNEAAASTVLDLAARDDVRLPVLLEIDSDGHRSGIKPDDRELINLGQSLASAGLLAGVLTHAGDSYNSRSEEELAAFAELERSGATAAADALRSAGCDCDIVSIGSTPTILFAQDLVGVTEVRAGVFMFGDLVMAGIGVLPQQDIALSVLASVIGHRVDRSWIIVDAGWMAMSRDRGTANQNVDQGYGVILTATAESAEDLVMISANQEHGIVARRDGGAINLDRYPVGTQLRVLPNHACATAAQHEAYHLVDGAEIVGRWERFGNW